MVVVVVVDLQNCREKLLAGIVAFSRRERKAGGIEGKGRCERRVQAKRRFEGS